MRNRYHWIALLFLSCLLVSAQQTPNLKLNVPPTGAPNWGPLVNQNFVILDSWSATVCPKSACTMTGPLNVPSLTATGAIQGGTIQGGTITSTGQVAAQFFNASGGYQVNGSYGTSGQVLLSTGSGSQWGLVPPTDIAVPGANGEVLINSNGGVNTISGLTYNPTTKVLSSLGITIAAGGTAISPGGVVFADNSTQITAAIAAGNANEVQINSSGKFGAASGVTYSNNGLSMTNLTVTGTPSMSLPPGQVTWPPTCATGVYVPATNTCVPTGTAANPAPAIGTLQMNAGGTFGPVNNSNADTSGNVTLLTLQSSVNSQLNIMAPPYNAKGDCVTNDSAAFNQWQIDLVTKKKTGYVPAPPGGCYIASFTFLGGSMIGQQQGYGGFANFMPVIIQGLPGQDVMHAPDPTTTNITLYNSGWSIENIQFKVNDSAAGSFPHRWPGRWGDGGSIQAGSNIYIPGGESARCGDVGQAIQIGSNPPTTISAVNNCNSQVAPVTYTLSAVAAASGGSTTYTGSGIPAINSLTGVYLIITGFTNAVNNGVYQVVSNTTTSIVLNNTAGVAETHAGTAANNFLTITLAANQTTGYISNAHTYVSLANIPVTTNIGPCGIAFDNQDSLTTDWATTNTSLVNNTYDRFNNVVFTTTNHANNSCGMFWQGAWISYGLDVRGFTFRGQVFAYASTPSELNSKQAGGGKDFQTFDHGSAETVNYPWIQYGGGFMTFKDVEFTALNGPQFMHNVSNIFGVGSADASVQLKEMEQYGSPVYGLRFDMDDSTITDSWLGLGSLQTIWDGSRDTCVSCVQGSTPAMQLNGNQNKMWIHFGPSVPYPVDNGFGNRIFNTSPYAGGPSTASSALSSQSITRRNEAFGMETADFIRSGNAASPYASDDDLIIRPQDVEIGSANTSTCAGGYSTCVLTDTQPNPVSGKVLVWSGAPSSSIGNVWQFQYSQNLTPQAGFNMVIGAGYPIPASKVNIIYSAYCPSGSTFNMRIQTLGTSPLTLFNGTPSCTTTPQVYTVVADLTTQTKNALFFVAPNSGGSTAYIQWIAIQPSPTIGAMTASVNKVLSVSAPPYNAYCDLAGGATTLTINTSGVTSGATFGPGDVNKRINGYTTTAPYVPVSVAIDSVSGGNATVHALPNGTPLSSGPLVTGRWFYGHDDQSSTTNGGVGTGIQGAFNDAGNTAKIQFPSGTCLTSTVTWRGQQFFGAGTNVTYIQGMPGQDIISTPNAGSPSFLLGGEISNLTFNVDTSVDASATAAGGNNAFPNRQGGMYNRGASYAVSGTLSTTAGSGAVVGNPASTAFLTQFQVGWNVIAGGETHTVISITDNSHLTTDPWTSTHSNVSASTGTTGFVQFQPPISPGPLQIPSGMTASLGNAAGTITTTAGSPTVTGSGTLFTSLGPGVVIIAGGETHTIATVTSATQLTTVDNWTNSNSGITYQFPSVSLSGSGTTLNLTDIPTSRVIGAPITIQGAGASGAAYTGTIAAVGNWNGSAQTVFLSAPVQTAVTNASGTLLNPISPPWYLGNAAIAIPCDNPTTCGGANAPRMVYRNLWFLGVNQPVNTPVGGALTAINNASHCVAFFTQIANYAVRFENLHFESIYAGYVESYPTTGTQSTADTSSFKDIDAFTTTIPMVTTSGNDRWFNGINLYSSGMPQSFGPFFLSAVGGTYLLGTGGWTINGLYAEGALTSSGENARFMSPSPINVTSGYTGAGGYVEFNTSGSKYDWGVGLARIDGNMNTFINSGTSSVNITDNGYGNIFDGRVGAGGGNNTQARRWNESARPARDNLGKLDASFLLSGNISVPYFNASDLVTTCEDWWVSYNGSNGNFSCVSDPNGTEITKSYYHDISNHGFENVTWAGSARLLGINFPQTKVTTYVLARSPGATGNWTISGRLRNETGTPSDIGSPVTLTFGANWTLQSFATDLTSVPYGNIISFRLDGPVTTGTSVDVAMVAFVPQRTDPLAPAVAQTLVACATSGTATFSEPLAGASDKKILIHLAACVGNAFYTFPVGFTNTPGVFPSAALSSSLISALNNVSVTVTGTTSTGTIVLEDY